MLSSIINNNRYHISLENKRLFIAIEIPPAARKAVYWLGSWVLKNCDGARSVKEDNIHITLKFLGSTPEDNIDPISDAITGAALSFNHFPFEINGEMDAFPNKERARVVFSAIGEGRLKLKLLYLSLEESLERGCRQFGVKAGPNDFMAHITIARLRHPGDITYAIIKAGTIPPVWIECRKIALFESMLGTAGVRYTKLREFSLK